MMAGIAGAAAWAAAEPVLARAFGTPYSTRRLLAGLMGVSSSAALAAHMVNGVLFGILFERAGGRGAGRGLLAAQAENLALWPLMAVAERIHPDCRSGDWPPLFRSGRIFAYEAAGHALFGAVLGKLVRG
jgi:hypothetical protein